MAPLDRSGLLVQGYGEPDSRFYPSSVTLPWPTAKVRPRGEKGRTIGAPWNIQPSQLHSEVAVQAGRRGVLIDESLVDDSSFLNNSRVGPQIRLDQGKSSAPVKSGAWPTMSSWSELVWTETSDSFRDDLWIYLQKG